jgi:GDP-mannose 6-dehydrogenase
LQLPVVGELAPEQRTLSDLLALIAESGQTEVIILGLTFKSDGRPAGERDGGSGTDTLARLRLRIYDPAVNLAALVGSNRRLIEVNMPHLASYLHADLGRRWPSGSWWWRRNAVRHRVGRRLRNTASGSLAGVA